MIEKSIQFNWRSSSYFIQIQFLHIAKHTSSWNFSHPTGLHGFWGFVQTWIIIYPSLFFGCLLLPYIFLNVSFDLFIYFFHWYQILQFWQSLTANASHNNYLNLLPFKTKKSNISCTKLCIYIHATTNTYIQQNWLCYAYTKKIIQP